MAILVASGNLVGVSQKDTLNFSHKHTGMLGVLIYGTWDASHVNPLAGPNNASSVTRIINPSNGGISTIFWNKNGLYYFEHVFDFLGMSLVSGTAETTNIEYKIFVRGRP